MFSGTDERGKSVGISLIQSLRQQTNTIWERPMPALDQTIATEFARFYREKATRIYELLAPLSDEQIWTRPYPYGNSIGHLLLHLTGNLNYYIGTEILKTEYVRDRPLEFSDPVHHSKESLLGNFELAIAMVESALRAQSADDWSAAYSAKGLEQAKSRFSIFMICAAHLGHHTGQIIYLCKEMERHTTSTGVSSR